MNSSIAIENLKLLKQACERARTPFWLTDGTLLGWYRENDFIGHDSDVDVGMFIEDLDDDLLPELKRSGFEVKFQFGTKECGLEYAIEREGIKIDIFFFYKETGDESFYWHGAWYYSGQTKSHVRTMIRYAYRPFDIVPGTFKGTDFMVPNDPEQYIIQKYGDNWRVPQKEWDWRFGPDNAEKTDITCEYEYLGNSFLPKVKLFLRRLL